MSAPRNPGLLGPNRGTRGTKVAFVRLSNEARSTSTDYAEMISGSGAPSGGYGRDAGATLIYLRTDASDGATSVYVSPDGGTTWSAMSTSSDIELAAATDITIATAVATLTGAVHTLRGEGAAADVLDTISGMADAEVAYLLAGAEQITIRDAAVGGGNIATAGDTTIVLETGDAVMAVRSGAVITVTPLALAAGIAPGHLALARGSMIIGNSGVQGSALDLSAADNIAIGDGTDVVALALPTTGIVAKTAAGAVSGRTLTGTANQVDIADGDGVGGNPTFSLPQSIDTDADVTFDSLALDEARFSDSAGSPAVEGYLQYNADHFEFYDGAAARTVLADDDIGVSVQAWDADLDAVAALVTPDISITANAAHVAGDGSDHSDVAANTVKTAMLTRETTVAGGKIELLEGTDNGVSKVIFQAPASLGADRTITIPDAAVTLADIATMAGSGVQAVGSGDAPTLAVTNMTGSAAGIDSDATTHAASDGSGHADVAANTADIDAIKDQLITATIAVADAAGGVTTAALTVDCFQADDGATVLGSARQIMIICSTAQYEPNPAPSGTATFGTATKGSIIDSGNSWCLAQTDAAGEFDATVTNSADEALYFRVMPPQGVSDIATRVLGCQCVADLATWSA